MTARVRRLGRPRAPGPTVLAIGLVVVVGYAASAWLSGRLSPVARQPLFDGLIPPAPYRWVDPPPELAPTNVEPTPETALVELANPGSVTAIVSTDDTQVTLILPRGVFAPAPQQRNVRVRIEPLPPDAVEPPEPPLRILGNVYRIRANYLPSDDVAQIEGEGVRAVLVYPFVSTDHTQHAVIVSRDGTSWSAVETNDFRSIQQADGPIETLGYLAVARTGTPASPTPTAVEGMDVATIAIVVGLVALAAGAALALRPQRSTVGRGGRRNRVAPPRRRDERKRPRGRASRPGRGAGRGSRRSR